MLYNWECCSFYPNNFGASALSCSLARRPLASIHVSTGLWKHVYWPVETRTLASGNTYTAKWTTVERASFNGSSP